MRLIWKRYTVQNIEMLLLLLVTLLVGIKDKIHGLPKLKCMSTSSILKQPAGNQFAVRRVINFQFDLSTHPLFLDECWNDYGFCVTREENVLIIVGLMPTSRVEIFLPQLDNSYCGHMFIWDPAPPWTMEETIDIKNLNTTVSPKANKTLLALNTCKYNSKTEETVQLQESPTNSLHTPSISSTTQMDSIPTSQIKLKNSKLNRLSSSLTSGKSILNLSNIQELERTPNFYATKYTKNPSNIIKSEYKVHTVNTRTTNRKIVRSNLTEESISPTNRTSITHVKRNLEKQPIIVNHQKQVRSKEGNRSLATQKLTKTQSNGWATNKISQRTKETPFMKLTGIPTHKREFSRSEEKINSSLFMILSEKPSMGNHASNEALQSTSEKPVIERKLQISEIPNKTLRTNINTNFTEIHNQSPNKETLMKETKSTYTSDTFTGHFNTTKIDTKNIILQLEEAVTRSSPRQAATEEEQVSIVSEKSKIVGMLTHFWNYEQKITKLPFEYLDFHNSTETLNIDPMQSLTEPNILEGHVSTTGTVLSHTVTKSEETVTPSLPRQATMYEEEQVLIVSEQRSTEGTVFNFENYKPKSTEHYGGTSGSRNSKDTIKIDPIKSLTELNALAGPVSTSETFLGHTVTKTEETATQNFPRLAKMEKALVSTLLEQSSIRGMVTNFENLEKTSQIEFLTQQNKSKGLDTLTGRVTAYSNNIKSVPREVVTTIIKETPNVFMGKRSSSTKMHPTINMQHMTNYTDQNLHLLPNGFNSELSGNITKTNMKTKPKTLCVTPAKTNIQTDLLSGPVEDVDHTTTTAISVSTTTKKKEMKSESLASRSIYLQKNTFRKISFGSGKTAATALKLTATAKGVTGWVREEGSRVKTRVSFPKSELISNVPISLNSKQIPANFEQLNFLSSDLVNLETIDEYNAIDALQNVDGLVSSAIASTPNILPIVLCFQFFFYSLFV